jgi:uncharacterized membrane protein
MRSLAKLLRTTVVGGALFLAPFAILVILLEKVFEILRRVINPLAEWLPFESLIGLKTPWILAILLLVMVCIVAGLFARTALAKRLVGWLETALLSNLPGYSFMRTVGEEYAAGTPTSTHQSVLIRLDDSFQLGFLVERLNSGHVVVFVPGAPKPWNGDVLVVEESRVTLLDPSSKTAVKCLQQLGSGTGRLVEGSLNRKSDPG